MRRLVLIPALAIVAFAQTQAFHQVSITVVVVDGKPIASAQVNHLGLAFIPGFPRPEVENTTDRRGRFTIKTDKPAVVIRKPGYASYRLLIDHDGDTRVTLLQLPPPLKCKPAQIPGVKTREVRDADYVEFQTYVETPDGPRGFAKGSGPMYSFGIPIDMFVWNSVEYSEVMYPSGQVDARGKMPDGTFWRERTAFGEATHYWDIDQPTAQLLDRLIDGDCHKE